MFKKLFTQIYNERFSNIGTTLEPVRFVTCAVISALSIILMMVIGISIPARKAMKIQAAEALHGE